MPLHKLSTAWTKIASAGENAQIINSGTTAVLLRRVGGALKLTPDGSATYSDLRDDVFARSEGGTAEIVITITPGLPKE